MKVRYVGDSLGAIREEAIPASEWPETIRFPQELMGRARAPTFESRGKEHLRLVILISTTLPTTYYYNTHESRDKFFFAIDLIVCKRKEWYLFVSCPN
jgi:hypothetical protein